MDAEQQAYYRGVYDGLMTGSAWAARLLDQQALASLLWLAAESHKELVKNEDREKPQQEAYELFVQEYCKVFPVTSQTSPTGVRGAWHDESID